MQLSPLFFTGRTKSLPSLQQTASAKDWADSLWRPQPHCRSYFISHFFGWRAVGISNRVRKEFSILFSPASAWARERLRFSFFFKKAGRSLLFPQFWPVAQRSWRSPGFCFFMNRLRGSDLSALCSPSPVCFCCANNVSSDPTRNLSRALVFAITMSILPRLPSALRNYLCVSFRMRPSAGSIMYAVPPFPATTPRAPLTVGTVAFG